ncbi:hypothetical protein BJ170DRAFT_437970 [Xylariales sp. AK1849]|nr:hypothetical protein BJ170DRAFT_437970 [Xylariales sp. AK1849]
MPKKFKTFDAWEDEDWETQADKPAAEPSPAPESQAPLTKKERLAKHAEFNRQIWESAQEPNNGAPLHYFATAPSPPLAQPFKAPPTVLARKPAPKMITKRDPVTGGISNLTIYDDSDDEKDSKPQETPEEMRARQQKERAEKQRRYDEARAKIFGESGAGGGGAALGVKGANGQSGRSSGASTPGTVTPPRSGGERRGRGRGRGGFRAHDRGASGDFQRPGSQSGGGASLREEPRERELYDPNYAPKPGFMFERKGGAPLSGRSTPREDEQIIRAPRGPDGGGRGGFGFAKRGAKEG